MLSAITTRCLGAHEDATIQIAFDAFSTATLPEAEDGVKHYVFEEDSSGLLSIPASYFVAPWAPTPRGRGDYGGGSPVMKASLSIKSTLGSWRMVASDTGRSPYLMQEAERASLQKMMDAFAWKACKRDGFPCTYIQEDDDGTTRVSASYGLDRSLTRFHVRSPLGSSFALSIICPLAKVVEVYSSDDGMDCFPPDVLAKVKPHEMDQLLMVVFDPDDEAGDQLRFCMLAESWESREELVECLRILCIYAESTN
jgi:hypothetical protein